MSFSFVCIDGDNTLKRIQANVIYKGCELEEELLFNNKLDDYFDNKIVLSLKQSDLMLCNMQKTVKLKTFNNKTFNISTMIQNEGVEDLTMDFQTKRVSHTLSNTFENIFNKDVEIELETIRENGVLFFLKEKQVFFVDINLKQYTQEQAFLLNNIVFCDCDEMWLDKGFYEYYYFNNNFKPIVELDVLENKTPLKVFVSHSRTPLHNRVLQLFKHFGI